MADPIKVTSNADVLVKKLERWAKVAPEAVKKTLSAAAMLVSGEVQLKHLSGPKMPRGVGNETTATLAVRTGRLRRSITQRVRVESSGKFSAMVGTNVGYARKHELGLEGLPHRPFLRPSLEKKRPEVFKFIEEAMMKSYGK